MVQDDADSGRDAELISRPIPTTRALTQVSRVVRAEVADIYWSRTKIHYSTHSLIKNKTHEDHCGFFRFQSWLSTWDMLAVPHVRLLYIELSFHSGRLDIQLKKYARPSINVWTGNGFGAEEGLKAFVTAVLFPDDCTKMTPERLEKVCEV